MILMRRRREMRRRVRVNLSRKLMLGFFVGSVFGNLTVSEESVSPVEVAMAGVDPDRISITFALK